MEGQNGAKPVTTTATTQSSTSIHPNQQGVSKVSPVSHTSGVGLVCVVGQDGQTLILSDAEGRENIISGVTPDILQQVSLQPIADLKSATS